MLEYSDYQLKVNRFNCFCSLATFLFIHHSIASYKPCVHALLMFHKNLDMFLVCGVLGLKLMPNHQMSVGYTPEC